ncbi:MAG: M48 family metalloprotease [Acidobacteria bacterium]|nr:M48 family metalloprotease [Acidobacteriota bacterium]
MTRHRALDHTTRIVLVALMALPAWSVSPSVPELPPPGNPSMSREDQKKLGLQAASEVYKQMPVLPDSSPITKYVKQLGAKLVTKIPPENSWPYQFHVVEQKEINAFALPGGPIFINIGTITAAANEAQLAGVMSHEMAHIYMQHTAKSMPRQNIQSVLGALGGMLGGAAGTIARLGVAGTGVFMMRYSRADETQADSVGAVIMYKSGYKPLELANFFETLKQQGGSPPQFLSSHPDPGNRTEAIQKQIRNWPPREYLPDSQAFQAAKSEATRVHAYNAQEIADGAKQGLWAQQNARNGGMPAAPQARLTNVSFDEVKPGPQFTEISRMGVNLSYPSNWTTAANQSSLTIVPRAGVSENAIAYGVIVSSIEPRGARTLDQAAADVIRDLQSSNPGLHQTGEIRHETAGGRDARAADLAGSSPLEEGGKPLPERNWLVVTQGGGNYVYLIFIAPERDFARLRPTYQKMLDSLQLE